MQKVTTPNVNVKYFNKSPVFICVIVMRLGIFIVGIHIITGIRVLKDTQIMEENSVFINSILIQNSR